MIARSILVLLLTLALSGTSRADLISNGTNAYGGDGAFSFNVDQTYTTAVGVGAMAFTKHGFANTAFGQAALSLLDNGNRNTAVGEGSGVASGDDNTASGFQALLAGAGSQNTAVGSFALGGTPDSLNSTKGNDNTALGYDALGLNTSGSNNIAIGALALLNDTTGGANTASGTEALQNNTTGSYNVASGWQALMGNTEGDYNTAAGVQALLSNTTGHDNTAIGYLALLNNTEGNNNTVVGDSALTSNQTGNNNAALGVGALGASDGNNNTGLGFNTLSNNPFGNGNIAVGSGAGSKVTSGSDDIYIGNKGKFTESDTIRLGSAQTHTFIAGIGGTPVSGSTVLINGKGQLGILASSARYKRDIENMGERSGALLQLRPVTFRYKQDTSGERQYGLVAEEVARVYPELVVRSETGEVQSVKYEELIPMLLNEVQHQRKELSALSEMRAENAALAARLARLEETAAGATTVVSR